MKKLPAQPNKGLIDGVAVLQELASRGRPVSCIELSEELGIEKTKVNRVLKTLAFLGLVKAVRGRKYVPGEGMHVLAAQSLYGSGLLRVSIKPLSSLNILGYTVAFGVLWRDRVSYLYHHSPFEETIEGLGKHASYPLGKSSLGMVLAASKSDEELEALLTGKTIAGFDGSFDEFMDVIRQIRRQGFAELKESDQHRTMAVAVGSPAFAAIALAGNIPDNKCQDLANLLKEKACEIETGLQKINNQE